MQQRLEEFLSAEGLSKAQFADTINVARAAISHIVAGRNKPSYEFIVNTINAFPSLNIEWLLCGKGTMYKDGSSQEKTYDDLFSVPAGPDPVSEPTPPIPVVSPTIEDTVADTTDLISKKQTTTACIKRIVVYYSDGTYKDYVPED